MNRPDRSAATIRRASRIGSRMARSYASVNDFLLHAIMANDNKQFPHRSTPRRSIRGIAELREG